ncbi:MAG: DNA polymerase alpha/epsilon subunit B-domain-containing protein [Piptocephalis tieghemiana]|nr:MAG: DNA polymerase alpha/epsilon subunit B-domain-containing protein [Piptocephalis tieghemiana]
MNTEKPRSMVMGEKNVLRSNDSFSLWNYTLSPGWTEWESEVLRKAFIRFGIGNWMAITASGALPGKTVAQMNLQLQRMLGQQSTAEFQGLHMDPKRVGAVNAQKQGADVKRKNGCLVNTGAKMTRKEIEERLRKNREMYEVDEVEWKSIELPAKLQLPTDPSMGAPTMDALSKTLQEKRDLLAKYEEELREIRSRLAKVKDAEKSMKRVNASHKKFPFSSLTSSSYLILLRLRRHCHGGHCKSDEDEEGVHLRRVSLPGKPGSGHLFGSELEGNALALTTFQSICTSHNLTPSELHDHWEAFSMALPEHEQNVFDKAHLSQFRVSVQREIQSMASSTPRQSHGGGPRKPGGVYDASSLDTLMSRVSTSQNLSSPSRPGPGIMGDSSQSPTRGLGLPLTPYPPNRSSASSGFIDRTDRGKVDVLWNEHIHGPNPSNPEEEGQDARVVKMSTVIGESKAYRYMWTDQEELRQVNMKRLKEMEEAIRESVIKSQGNDSTEDNSRQDPKEQNPLFTSPSEQSQSGILSFGRIACDSDARLNPRSLILLPPSHSTQSSNYGVRLLVDTVSEYSLFPGQPALPPSPTTSPKLPLRILSATGPYTLDDSLSYQVLDSILQEALKMRPHLLILMGPFVDVNHPLIQSAQVQILPEQLWASEVIRRLEMFSSQCPFTQIVLVPGGSGDLVGGEWVGLPQPPLSQSPLLHSMIPKNIHCVSNPSVIEVDGLRLGLFSTDILFHLSAEEISRDSQGNGKDRLARLSEHLLLQRSFYPLEPPAPGEILEYERLQGLSLGDVKPHCLLLASQLKTFVKDIHGCLVVNGGKATRRKNGGTMTKIILAPPSGNSEGEGLSTMDEGGSEGVVDHGRVMVDHARVEIVKI